MQNIAVLEAGDGIAEIGFALLCRTTDYGLQTTEGKAGIRNYGFAELRKLASLCYAGQRTTDNGGYAGTTELWNHGIAENWLRFAMQDNRLQTTDNGGQSRHSELRNYGGYARQRTTDNGGQSRLIAHNSLHKNIITLLHYIFRTTDNGQRRAVAGTTELWNYGSYARLQDNKSTRQRVGR